MESQICCICDSNTGRPYKQIGNYILLQCPKCNLVYLTQGFFRQEEFIKDAKTDLDHKEKQKIEYWSFPSLFDKHRPVFEKFFKERLQRMTKYNKNIETLLDIGCGYGFWMDYCEKRGIETQGFDISSEAVNYAKDQLGLNVTHDDLIGFQKDRRYDVAILFDVLEHLEDPNKALQKCRTLIKPKGLLYLQVPNLIGFRIPNDHGYGLPHHLWQFNPKSLSLLLEKNGFDVLDKWTGPMGVIGAYEKGTNLFFKKLVWGLSSKLNLGTRLQMIAKSKEN